MRADIVRFNVAVGDALSYEMVSNVDVFRPLVRRALFGERGRALIVDPHVDGVVHGEAFRRVTSYFFEERAYPDGVVARLGNGHIFRLR